MGLLVTTTTQTSKGSTRELYLHIREFYQNKDGLVQLPVKYYKSQGGDEVNVLSPPFEVVFKYQLEGNELIAGISKVEAYEKIKQTLVNYGKTVEDVI